MSAISHDLVVIGAGVGGYVAAIRAAQLGLNDIARTCHAHPTLAEAMKKAALAVHGCSIHS